MGECKEIIYEDPNCTYKCASQACWEQVFLNSDLGVLEPGEVDYERDRIYQTCARNEDNENKKKRRHEAKLKQQQEAASASNVES